MAAQKLKVCVFASSRTTTPDKYLKAARELGRALARGGHLCINGGGRCGGMGALNEGVKSEGGKVRSVIHHKWIVDKVEFKEADEIIVANGNNLQERKRLLWETCDCIIVLPGGTGTFDEMWEVACHNAVGFGKIPMVVLSIDGYYDGFRQQLERAQRDGLLYGTPDSILHVETDPEAALAWCAAQVAAKKEDTSQDNLVIQERNTIFIFRRRHSFVAGLVVGALGVVGGLALGFIPLSVLRSMRRMNKK